MSCSESANAYRPRTNVCPRMHTPSLSASALLALIMMVLSTTTKTGVHAFQLSMVASSRPPRIPFSSSTPASTPNTPQQRRTSSSSTTSVTSGLISNLAVVALKLRLKEQTEVTCDVTASSSHLLWNGQVGPVTVKGRGWKSPLGLLTCRAIEATVEMCDLDMGRILSHRKLVLTKPAKGTAMVALDASDFGSFITHPLMKPPALENGEGEDRIRFEREGVTMDASTGRITFFGTYMDETWKCTLQRGHGAEQRARVTVEPHSNDSTTDDEMVLAASEQLTRIVSDFFNEMVFELDGTFLSFRDMQLTDRGGAPSVMLALGITVKKFPSPGLSF